ncbi:MAG: site-2 protease family protein [Actinomycetota bacterium]
MLEAILGLAVLLASVVIHENAHGVAAFALGDDTARAAGRITLNPAKHLDIVGSVILPALLFFTTGSMFGYAKPVPVNPAKLRGKDRWGFALVALAGPAANLVLAFIAAVIANRLYGIDVEPLRNVRFSSGDIAAIGVVPFLIVAGFVWNVLLAAFNLIPIPPLDGSRIMRVFLTENGRRTLDRIEPYGFLILFAVIIWLQEPLSRIIGFIESGLLRILPL